MIITEIEALNRSKTQIVIDDDIRFVLPAQAVGALGLFPGRSCLTVNIVIFMKNILNVRQS
ncbi:MAG: hypothetical protein V8S08_07155 [Lachnoclostridium sp.]